MDKYRKEDIFCFFGDFGVTRPFESYTWHHRFTWDRKNIPGGHCDSSEGETNRQVEKQRRGVAKRQIDRRTATMIRQVERKNISKAEWKIILSARQMCQMHHFTKHAPYRVGGGCECVCAFTLSTSCGVADSRVSPPVTQWRARMPYWLSPISSSQSHTCSVLHLEKGIFRFLTRWGEKTEDEHRRQKLILNNEHTDWTNV